MMAPDHITVADGKYTLIMDPSNMRALRYGEPWLARDLGGDGLIMALGHEIQRLREELAALKRPPNAPDPANRATVDWFVCRADAGDVEWARAKPKPTDPDYKELKRQGKHLNPRNPALKIGDELWRVPLSIGPASIDRDHWSGYHLTCTPAQAERIAYLINNDPDFPHGDPS